MAETGLETIREMLRVTSAAQMVFDGETLAAASAAAVRLFPAAREGVSAEELFGEEIEQFRLFQPGQSRLFPVTSGETVCDVTMTEFRGYTLVTAAETGARLGMNTLRSVAERLRQPMAAALAVTPKLLPLLEDAGDPAALERAAELNHSLYTILRVTRNLELAGTAEQPLPLQVSLVNLSGWFTALMERAAELTEAAGLTLEYETATEYCPCDVDSAKLERALLNLLSNAMKFSEPGGKIRMTLRQSGRRAIMTVRDWGCGIPPDQMDLVFSRSEHRGPIPDPRWGVGLGLPLARQIAEAHGGRLMLESREGEGTAVHLSLPLRTKGTEGVRSPLKRPEDASGLDSALVELADALPAKVYDTRSIDL